MERSKVRSKAVWVILAVTLMALVIFGCGGGGGGGGGTTSTTSSTSSTSGVTGIQLYALYSGTQSPAAQSLASSGPQALSFSVGDRIQLSFIGVSTLNNQQYITVTGGSLTTNAPANVASLNGNLLSVLSASSSTYSIVGTYQGKQFNFTFTISAPKARVSGLVRDTSGSPVVGVPIDFYAPGGGLIGKSNTGPDGTFIGSIPDSSTGFNADLSSTGAYFNEYAYSGKNYTISVSSCPSPLPKLTTGSTTPLPGTIVAYPYASLGAPPPPTGCG